MSNLHIFIIEDDDFYARLLRHHLSLNPDNEVSYFTTAKDALGNLHRKPDVVTLDYGLPDMDGVLLLKKIKEQLPDVPVIVVSGQEDVSTAIELLKQGAYDYVVKNDETKDRLWSLVNRIRESVSLKDQISRLQEEVGQKYDFSNIKGSSSRMQHVFNMLKKASNTNITVSITGETGTGKELVAKAIHFNSPQKDRAFVAVNIAAIPSELIESELFGHEKGAFTGANNKRKGKFEEAHKGTLFLDEIGEMDIHLQSKLLRALQEREISRVGGNEVIKVDVRVICATHRNLAEEVKAGNFRQDLYYRLLGLPIDLPPLRERGNDVIMLAKNFMDAFTLDNKMKKKQLSEEVCQKLTSYHWPGNVRELRAVMELACVLADGDEIGVNDINFNNQQNISDIVFEEGTLRDYTSRIIKHFLDRHNNNVVEVADRLDIGKSTIYRMIKNNEI